MTRDPAPDSTVPADLQAWMERFIGDASEERGDELMRAAVLALREALARPGPDREGAFALLAGDALLTRAAERSAEDPDPEVALRGLLGGVSDEVRGAGL